MSVETRKVRIGRVVSDKMDKTAVVMVGWHRAHRLYRKPVRRRSRFYAHDEDNNAKLGDVVRIVETRPLSKTKRWRVAEILVKADLAEIQPEEIVADIHPELEEAAVAPEPVEAEEPVAEVEVEEEPAAEESPSRSRGRGARRRGGGCGRACGRGARR